MKESSIYILVLHAAILAIQLGLGKVFPHARKATFGVYFILMPVGFTFFMPPPPIMSAILVLSGLIWVFYWANRDAARSFQPDTCVSALAALPNATTGKRPE